MYKKLYNLITPQLTRTLPMLSSNQKHFDMSPRFYNGVIAMRNKSCRYENGMTSGGFTLVELAIVIVIIGLLVGGVLQGQELITQAKIRSQIKQLQEFETAFRTFQSKYSCVPGDCINASTFFSSGVVNGNGNGDIENNALQSYDGAPYPSWTSSPEYSQFFVQLSTAKMVKNTFDGSRVVGLGMPELSYKSKTGFFASSTASFSGSRNPNIASYQTGKNAFFLVVCASTITNPIIGSWDDNCGIFRPIDLSQIDSKIDDGKPLSGILFGFGGHSSNNNCITSNTYNLTIDTEQCQSLYIFDK